MSSVSTATAGRATPDSEVTAIDSDSPRSSAIPSDGKNFMITDETFQHALALHDGDIQLIDLTAAHEHLGACWIWKCVERSGWLGFRNAASGTYLGADCSGSGWLRTHSQFLDDSNRICLLPQADGKGFTMRISVKHELRKVEVAAVSLWDPSEHVFKTAVDITNEMVWCFVEA
ncbi:hypothetical protein QBC44DRAFT_336495 [Cladorrhinum sp. PSN332]|nr:hypothetical protein QBC44DRAFT_336495 [Cladorrhinum sp. PSN332]